MNKQFGLSLGALSPKLADQLQEQGLTMEKHNINHWQRVIDALIRIRFAGLLTDSQYDAAARKMVKKISEDITEVKQ